VPYDAGLAERLQDVLEGIDVEPIKMFGGLGYLLNGYMCVGIYREFLIIRIGKETAARIQGEPHVLPMDITGRPMKGWARIAPQGMVEDDDLARYCRLALDFVGTLPPR
jgi:hypothetical protein